MPFDDQNVDISGVDDRRGRGLSLPIALGGGGSLVGLLLLVALNVLGGGDGISALVPDEVGIGAGAETTQQLRDRCNSDGAINRYDDCYVIKSYNEINEVWAKQFDSGQYQKPRLIFFEQATSTGCGSASSSVGPFYCPPDKGVYIDLGFLAELQRRFGANGRYAQTYIVAHEVAHHVQNLTGTEARVAAAISRDASQQQSLSIGLELQADCYAGVWSALANRAGNYSISEAQLDEALNAAAAVGDDRIQQKVQGRVNPETWTHGSSAQRRAAFLTGYGAADAQSCASLVPDRG